jgi:PAS domain S-box-containing protein
MMTLPERRDYERLLQAQIDLEAILNSFHGDLVITDGNGHILNVSRSCERLYGLSKEAFIGKNVEELERQGVFKPSITKKVLQERKRISMVQQARDNKKVLVTAVPVFDESGGIMRVVSYTHDVTEMMELQQHLGELRQEMMRMTSELELLRKRELSGGEAVVFGDDMAKTVEIMHRVAKIDVTLLLLGESGVGKSLYARYIHQLSARADGPFIEVNCGAIPESLFESELFGYESGAFTGARKGGKIGLFELANKGTIFLDEIGELPLSIQVKLLKVIQEKRFRRVGGTQEMKSDVRIIAATNRNLENLVQKGRFREDLYFRLNVVPIRIPPLRERPNDIRVLAEQMLEKFNTQYGLRKTISENVYERLRNYAWPGNVRELEHLIERLIVTVDGPIIDEPMLPREFFEPSDVRRKPHRPGGTLPEMLAEVEKQILLEARNAGKSTTQMARELGISQASVVRKLQRYGITKGR